MDNIKSSKIYFLIIIFSIMASAIILRMIFFGITGEEYAELAKKQSESFLKIPVLRSGIITDDNVLLRYDSINYEVRVDTRVISKKNWEKVLKKIPYEYKKNISEDLDFHKKNNHRFLLIGKVPSRTEAEDIYGIYGVILYPKIKRNNKSDIMVPLLGKYGSSKSGRTLFEKTITRNKKYDNLLALTVKGSGAFLKFDSIKNRRDLFNPGNIKIFIQADVQKKLQYELYASIEKYRAKSGAAVVVDLYTGGIIAFSRFLTKNKGGEYEWMFHKKRFEPGSIMKPLIYTYGINSGVISPYTTIDCHSGVFKLGKWKIHDVHAHKELPAKDVVVYSSNIGISEIALKMGKKLIKKMVTELGLDYNEKFIFGVETKSRIPDFNTIPDISLATISYGHGISMTMSKIVTAYGKILTNNINFRLRFLKGYDKNKNNYSPLVSKRASEAVKQALYEVVQRGTARRLKKYSVIIGGKTGTAEKVKNGKYSRKDVVGSFIGFSYIGGRGYLSMVSIDEPRKAHYGGTVAAPVVGKVLEFLNNKFKK